MNKLVITILAFCYCSLSWAITATNLSHQGPPKNQKEQFYYEIKGQFFSKKILMKGEQRVRKHLAKYYIVGLVQEDTKTYELALQYEQMANYTNAFFWGITAGILGAIYGVIASEDGITAIGGLVSLVAVGPYLYYRSKTNTLLNETINTYNGVKRNRSSLLKPQEKSFQLVSWSFSF